VDVEHVSRVDQDVCAAAQASLRQRRMDGTGGEDRRDREPVRIEASIADHEDVRAPLGGVDRFAGQAVQGQRQPVAPVGSRPAGVESADAAPAVDERCE
jgi:hypothetical protein